MQTKNMTSTTKGLIIGLILVFVSLLIYLLIPDLEKQQSFAWISYLLIIGLTALAALSYARDMNGDVTFGQVFSHGFKTAAVFTIIVLVYAVLSSTVIFPEMKEKSLDLARSKMEQDGNLSDDQIDKAIEMTGKFFMPFIIGGVVVSNLILGAIGSLIGAAVAKKNPQPKPFE